MAHYPATLIQDVGEWIAYVEKPLWLILGSYPIVTWYSTKDALEWLIREEIEVLYGLETFGHRPGADPMRQIHHHLDRALPMSLSVLTGHYIKAPRLYSGNPFVQVDLKNLSDLYIQYYPSGT